LVAALRERPRPNKVVDFPCTHGECPIKRVRIIVPSATANAEAQRAAHVRLRDEMKIPTSEWETITASEILGDLVAKEMIARMVHLENAIKGTNKYPVLFTSSRDVEELISADELAVLHALCVQTQFELGPRLKVLTDNEVDQWIEALKGGFDPLAYLQSPDLGVLVRGLHRRLVESTTSQLPDSPPPTWRDLSASKRETFAMDTICSGALPEPPSIGIASNELTDDEAREIALEMSGKTKPIT
jgi:hypothetical protein